jgi:FkbM family methyltransferase
MNFVRAHLVDEIATRDPERLGYGYADTQHPWHHDAAIDCARLPFLELLERIATVTGGHGSVLVVGLGPRPGLPLALRAVASRIVTVDANAQHLEALRAVLPAHDRADTLVHGDPLAPEVAAEVARLAADCDAVLFDVGDGYADMRTAWVAFAPLVRAGGLVAIVDRTQAFPGDRHVFDVDRFVVDLERDVLVPRGARLRRCGGALAVHTYEQSAALRGAEPPAWPFAYRAEPAPVVLGTAAGFSLCEWRGRVVAFDGSDGPLRPRRLERNGYTTVLVAADRDAAARIAQDWPEVRAQLAQARTRLRDGDVDGARQIVAAVAGVRPWLHETMVASLETAPWNRDLLLAQGTLLLFGTRPREGAALMRRALGLELVDAQLMQTVANAYLRVLTDEAAARSLLADGRQRVRARKVAQVCHTRLRGNVLWHYPQLLARVQSVLHVGSGRGDHLGAWTQLEIGRQTHVEADAEEFARLERSCREVAFGTARAVHAVLGAVAGPGMLHRSDVSLRPSLLAPSPLALHGRVPRILGTTAVEVVTLDGLVAAGAIDPHACDLLFVDTEGTELEVLRGATNLLRHTDVVCVAVFLAPIHEGAPMPQDIQRFLREIHDGDGFGLRAFEPGDDPARGMAVFRRVRRREVGR